MVDDVEITVSVNEDAESFSNAKMLIIVCEVWHGTDEIQAYVRYMEYYILRCCSWMDCP